MPISVIKVETEKEEQINEKYIGYDPVNIFEQSAPLIYPYVIMPKLNSVIKFPRKGKVGRKGFKEESFDLIIKKHFKKDFQIFDDRFVLIKNNNKPYEPDFTLIDEKSGINIFLDIEIDEPYEGLNDLTKRKATHFQNADAIRNDAFAARGWIVIRFAEIQVHQDPDACCNFIVEVIQSINQKYIRPVSLIASGKLKPLNQWTKEEAENFSLLRFREKYLGITNFGIKNEKSITEKTEETIFEKKVENIIKEQEKDFLTQCLNPNKTFKKRHFIRFIPHETKVKIRSGVEFLEFKIDGTYNGENHLLVCRSDMYKNMSKFRTIEYANFPFQFNGYGILFKSGVEKKLILSFD